MSHCMPVEGIVASTVDSSAAVQVAKLAATGGVLLMPLLAGFPYLPAGGELAGSLQVQCASAQAWNAHMAREIGS